MLRNFECIIFWFDFLYQKVKLNGKNYLASKMTI